MSGEEVSGKEASGVDAPAEEEEEEEEEEELEDPKEKFEEGMKSPISLDCPYHHFQFYAKEIPAYKRRNM